MSDAEFDDIDEFQKNESISNDFDDFDDIDSFAASIPQVVFFDLRQWFLLYNQATPTARNTAAPSSSSQRPKQQSAIIMASTAPTISISKTSNGLGSSSRGLTDLFRRIVISEPSAGNCFFLKCEHLNSFLVADSTESTAQAPSSPERRSPLDREIRFEAEAKLREQAHFVENYSRLNLDDQLVMLHEALDAGSTGALEAFREFYGRSEKVQMVQTDPRFSHVGIIKSIVKRIPLARHNELALILEIVTILARTGRALDLSIKVTIVLLQTETNSFLLTRMLSR